MMGQALIHGIAARGKIHQHVYAQFLCMQLPTSAKKTKKLRFCDLFMQKLLVKRWWKRPEALVGTLCSSLWSGKNIRTLLPCPHFFIPLHHKRQKRAFKTAIWVVLRETANQQRQQRFIFSFWTTKKPQMLYLKKSLYAVDWSCYVNILSF